MYIRGCFRPARFRESPGRATLSLPLDPLLTPEIRSFAHGLRTTLSVANGIGRHDYRWPGPERRDWPTGEVGTIARAAWVESDCEPDLRRRPQGDLQRCVSSPRRDPRPCEPRRTQPCALTQRRHSRRSQSRRRLSGRSSPLRRGIRARRNLRPRHHRRGRWGNQLPGAVNAEEALDALVATLDQIGELLPTHKDEWDQAPVVQLAIERSPRGPFTRSNLPRQ
jgi:hypothetical protein